MKKQVMALLAGVALMSTLAFRTLNYEIKSSSAEVEQMQGLYIFTDSKPVKEFEYLGTEKVGMMLGSPQYAEIRDKLIKKVKKEYPKANGVVFHFGGQGGADRADAILLK